MRRIAVAVFLVLLARPLLAQEFTIFDLNDFIDPRELGATLAEDGAFRCPCLQFLITRAIVGVDHDFLNVMQPTQLDVGFVHLATSYYRGPWQFNLKTTLLRELRRPEAAAVSRFSMPREALALQIGKYRTSKYEAPSSDEEDTPREEFLVERYQLSWRISRYLEPSDDSPATESRTDTVYRHEFGAEMDLRTKGVVGSITYTMIADEADTVSFSERPGRLAYVYRFDAYEAVGLKFEPTFSLGVVTKGIRISSRFTIQPGLTIALPLGSTGANFNLRIAPTFQRFGGWHESYEVAAFVDRHIFADTW